MDERGGESPNRSFFGRLRRLYREHPVLAWVGTAVLVGVIVAVALIVLLGGGSEPANVAIKCSVHEHDGTINMTLHAKVTQKEADEGGCTKLADKISGAASYWVVGLAPTPSEEPEVVCALKEPEQPATIIVEEIPGISSSRGTAACGLLSHAGWSQDFAAPTVGPWQAEYDRAVRAEEAVEAQEQKTREREDAQQEAHNQAVYRCQERAETKEEAELEAIEQETEERVNSAPESREYEIEEEGYEREQEAYERRESASERCVNEGEAEVETEGEMNDGVFR